MGSWAQMKKPKKEKREGGEGEKKKKKKSKKDKEKDKPAIVRISTSSFEIGELSTSPGIGPSFGLEVAKRLLRLYGVVDWKQYQHWRRTPLLQQRVSYRHARLCRPTGS